MISVLIFWLSEVSIFVEAIIIRLVSHVGLIPDNDCAASSICSTFLLCKRIFASSTTMMAISGEWYSHSFSKKFTT